VDKIMETQKCVIGLKKDGGYVKAWESAGEPLKSK
jgi:hypothetical protein